MPPAEIRTLPLLRGLRLAALEEIERHGVVRRFAAAEPLWTAGTESRGLFLVLSGRVRVVRAPGGRQHTLHEEATGGTLGEVPLFSGGRYPATAIAVEPTVCLAVDAQTLARAVAADPELAFRLLRRLAGRVRLLASRLDQRETLTVRMRLAAHILARQQGAEGSDFALGGDQLSVAEDLGTVREVLVRELRMLCRSGIIQRTGRARFRVTDLAGLQRTALTPLIPP